MKKKKKKRRGKPLKNKNPNLKSLLLNKNERFLNRPCRSRCWVILVQPTWNGLKRE